jgi:hypothetical protein
MTRALATLICVLFCFSARAENLLPQSFFDLRGPCYPPDELRGRLKSGGFVLVATGQTLAITELDAVIHFYRADDNFIIALTHSDLICTILLGEDLNFGV